MEAAQKLDAKRSLEHRVQELIAEREATETFSSKSKRKHWRVAIRKEVSSRARETCVHRPILEAFVLFQIATAARRAESLTLPWRHIDFEKKTAFLPETKNGRARTLALRDDLIELLKALPREGELVFNLTVKTCRTSWEAIMEATGIENLNVHDLRHEGISAAAESGLTLAELQAFSGHRDIRMLLRYTHLCMSKLAAKLSAALAAGTLKNGRRRMKAGELKLSDLTNAAAEEASSKPIPTPPRPVQPGTASNVIEFPGKHRERT
jgi:integrase